MKKKQHSGKPLTFAAQCSHYAPRVTAWAALGLFAGLTALALIGGRDGLAPSQSSTTAGAELTYNAPMPPLDPTSLSAADKGLYAHIDSAQEAGDFARADEFISHLSNRGLVGYILAERYLDARYSAKADELAQWLATYADQPQATRIASLARSKGVHVNTPAQEEALRGEGGTDHLGRSGMPDAWYTALGYWREGNYAEAAHIFGSLSDNESLGEWQSAAAHFWAYRAQQKLGNEADAAHHLKLAASYPTTFYGLLANAKRGVYAIDAEAPEVSTRLRHDPRAIRAALLVQMDRSDEAEDELRALYSAASPTDRPGLVTLASEMDLPNFQIRLSRTKGLARSEARYAAFPMPSYMLSLDGVIDPALVMAVARNESGFREVARSGAGATGMMQMLPSTARAVEKHVGEELLRTASADATNLPIAQRLNDPALSARYGAEYLKMLASQPAVSRNLVHLLVGYNAGIGRVISWKAAGANMNDPLLYIESMPFAETRNYVMQVSAQYWVYQMMMDETPTTLKALASGQWPVMKPATRA